MPSSRTATSEATRLDERNVALRLYGLAEVLSNEALGML